MRKKKALIWFFVVILFLGGSALLWFQLFVLPDQPTEPPNEGIPELLIPDPDEEFIDPALDTP